MKVLHYINNLGSGGAEKLLSDILPLINKQGIEVELIIANSKVNVEKYVKILQDHNIRIINLNLSFYNPYQIFKLINHVNNNNIDIIHAHLFPTQYWLSIASLFFKKKVKLVKTEHSVFNERKNYRILIPIEKFVYSRYHRIIAITDEVKANLARWIGPSNIITIHNGVNISQIKAEQDDIEIKNYSFLKKENFNILMVGRFDGWQKDQQTLVNSIALLPKNFKLYFAGEGHFIDEVKKLCHSEKVSESVFFLGLRQDVYKLMNLVDLNVLSTNHEGLSGVVLESLASEKPFLGSDVVGVKEIVPDQRFLFPKGNSKELATRILKIANDLDLRNSMSETALSYVKKYDIVIMVQKYIEVYKDLYLNNIQR